MSKKKNVSKVPREMTHRQLSLHKRQLRRQRIFIFGGLAIIVAVIGIILGGWLAGEYLPLHKTVIEVFETKFDTSFFIDTMVMITRLQSSASMSEISNAAVDQITHAELIIQEAGKLGITATDEEARQYLRDFAINIGINIEINDASIHMARSIVVSNKLREEHFSPLVPDADSQTHVLAMMVESEAVAVPLRTRILNGENFSLLAEQYANDTPSQNVLGDYGWHPDSIFKDKFSSTVPYDYISRDDARVGDVSQPLADNLTYKDWTYWLIRVNERPDEATANVSALILGSEVEALAVRAKLEAGADLATLADELSQSSTSQVSHGDVGLVYLGDNITSVFNGHVFNADTKIGEWSQPLFDKEYASKGGVWLVKIADKEANRPLTTEDRDLLINRLYYEWTDTIFTEYSPSFINNLTDDLLQWAVERVMKQLNIKGS